MCVSNNFIHPDALTKDKFAGNRAHAPIAKAVVCPAQSVIVPLPFTQISITKLSNDAKSRVIVSAMS